MSENDSPVKTPRTPRERQLEVIKRNIAALDRIGHHYAAARQRELLAELGRGTKEGGKK